MAIPLAIKGGIVKASDISSAMATEAQRRADSLTLKGSASFETADLESLTGWRAHIACEFSIRCLKAENCFVQ